VLFEKSNGLVIIMEVSLFDALHELNFIMLNPPPCDALQVGFVEVATVCNTKAAPTFATFFAILHPGAGKMVVLSKDSICVTA